MRRTGRCNSSEPSATLTKKNQERSFDVFSRSFEKLSISLDLPGPVPVSTQATPTKPPSRGKGGKKSSG